MKREMLFIREIAIQADAFYGEGEEFGKWAFKALGRDRSQIKKLENIANSTLKASDVLDYIKKQTGKHREWHHQNTSQQKIGSQLIDFISDTLKKRRDLVCDFVASVHGQPEVTDRERQQAYIALIREFIRQVSAQYELEVSS